MAVNIKDWSGHDRSQYFSGAFVLVNVRDSGQILARITEFEGSDHVVVESSGQRLRVPIDDVDWDGLPPRRCVVAGATVYFISPLGARTTRKPVTRGNLGTVIIRTNGTRELSARELSTDIIDQYLRGSVYPTDVEDAAFMVRNNDCVALSPSLAYIRCYHERYDEEDDCYREDLSYRIYRDSVEIYRSEDQRETIDYVTDNWETLSE